MTRQLIVTADDFGADIAVNEAVEIAHRQGILTAASLMVAGAAAGDAVARAKAMPALGVGLHVVLVDGVPVLPAEQVPALVGPDGRFHASMLRTAFAIALSGAARRQMQAEIAAQFAAFARTGLPLDHVNAHKHFHLHPMVASAIINTGLAYGLKAMRMPHEAESPLALRLWAGLLGRRWRARGIKTNDAVFGLSASGRYNATCMASALAALPNGLNELYCHPATADAYPGSAPGYRYRDELAALIDPTVRAALTASGAISGSFARFSGAQG